MSQENPIRKQPLIRHVNRQQMSWRAVDVEHLISEDHPAKAIWTLVGRLNLSAFYQAIESSTEDGGRPAIDPHSFEAGPQSGKLTLNFRSNSQSRFLHSFNPLANTGVGHRHQHEAPNLGAWMASRIGFVQAPHSWSRS